MATTPIAYQPHDHERCIDTAVHRAQTICRQRDARLTPLRREVLELVWQSHKPLGAYTILEQLAERGGRSARPAPPTVYRALDFLQELGLVHRLASRNAFIGCHQPEHEHQGHFLICRNCEIALELTDAAVTQAMAAAARHSGFTIEQSCIELVGLCPACQ